MAAPDLLTRLNPRQLKVSEPVGENSSEEQFALGRYWLADCNSGDAVSECLFVTGPEVAGVPQMTRCDPTDDAKMPAISSIMGWVFDGKHDEFSEQYTRAREAQAELWADEVVSISDEAVTAADNVKVQAARLRVDARKWVAAKLLPKRYGDKVQHTGDGGGPLTVEVVKFGQGPRSA